MGVIFLQEPYTRESFRAIMENAERRKNEKRGSAVITALIIAVFLISGVFYLKTSKPDVYNSITAYIDSVIKGKKSLETIGDALFNGMQETENMAGESGEILKTAENLSFDYLPDHERYALLACMHTQSVSMPLKNSVVTSPFGDRTDPVTGEIKSTHHGIDLAADKGSPILAYKAGTVIETGSSEIYGNYVLIRHSDSLETFYGHMSEISVKEGERVLAGSTVGIIGSTGKSTGTHLHFEIHLNGQRVDPKEYLYEKI